MKAISAVFVFMLLTCAMFAVFHLPSERHFLPESAKALPHPHYESRRKYPKMDPSGPSAYLKDLNNMDVSYLSAIREFGHVELPSKDQLRTLSRTHLTWIYHSYIDNINFLCQRKLRMGRVGDGGWEICDDEPYRPVKPCLVYSFGINYDFTFDDDVAKFYQCQVFSFDPSMKRENHSRSSLVFFSKLGIRGETTRTTAPKWDLMTLHSITQKFNHSERNLDVLKMDVEGYEWGSLRHMIASGDLSRVRQLLVEFHMYKEFKTVPEGLAHLDVLVDLHNLGFRKFYVHKNPGKNSKKRTFRVTRTPCYEVHFVNIHFHSVT